MDHNNFYFGRNFQSLDKQFVIVEENNDAYREDRMFHLWVKRAKLLIEVLIDMILALFVTQALLILNSEESSK